MAALQAAIITHQYLLFFKFDAKNAQGVRLKV